MGKAAVLLASLFSCVSFAADEAAVKQARNEFVERMVADHGFDARELATVLEAAQIQQSVLDAMSRPAERVVPWHEYRNIFLTDARIAAGVEFWKEHAATLERISSEYGVAPEMVVGIIGVETFFGRIMGKYRVIDSLATLAFAYPPRAKFFASELESFLLLTRDEGVDVFAPLGSYAGAMGGGQFIPSSYRAFAVDGNGDGRRDIWGDWEDVIGSVANYFRKHDWAAGQPVADEATRAAGFEGAEPKNGLDLNETVGSLSKMGYVFSTELPPDTRAAAYVMEAPGGASEYWIGYHNFRVITRYNRSPKYALAAHQLSQAIRAGFTAAAGSQFQ